MQKQLKQAMLAGLAFTVAIPTFATTASATDYINEGDGSLLIPSSNDSEGVFTGTNKDRREWYTKKGYNRVYKTYKNHFYFYSPVRPRDVKKGLADYSGIYENYYTRKSLSESNWDTRNMLVSRDKQSPLYNQNFKTKAKSLSTTTAGKGGGYTSSINKDNTGQFAGRYGEWRYLGYSNDGATTSNPFFPEDYITNYNPNSSPYFVKPWNGTGMPKTFVPGSTYDTAAKGTQKRNQKVRVINLLRAQSPTMATKSTSHWMDRLSLTSPPMMDTASFRGAWKRFGSIRYVDYALVNLKERRNLMVTRMEIIEKDSGDVVAVYTNNTPGKAEGVVSYRGDKVVYTQTKYDVKITVKNMNQKATRLAKSEVDAGFKKNYNSGTTYPSNFKGTNGNEFSQKLTGGKIPANSTQNFYMRDVVVPDDQSDKMVMFNSIIGAKHRNPAQDNLNSSDDTGVIPINVRSKPGNMEIDKIELLNDSGVVVKQPIPGEKYRVRYTYKYEGGDIRQAQYTSKKDKNGNTQYTFSHYSYPTVKLSVKSNIERKLPLGGSDYSQETVVINSKVRNGQEFKFDTKEAVVYENPFVKATGDFDISDAYSKYNSGTDRGTKTWERPYDYGIENLQVVPRTERAVQSGKMKVAVSFTATQDSPAEATKVKFQEDVDMVVNVNGTKKNITEHLTEGKNRNIVVEMDVDANPGDILTAKVDVNSSRDAWEFSSTGDVFANNSKTTIGNTKLIGKDGDNYGNTNTSGYVANKMLFPEDDDWGINPSNEWTQEYDVQAFSGKRITYKSKSGTPYSFTKYSSLPPEQTVEVKQNESYEIEQILFRSKYTKDNKIGKDGWVNMLEAEDLPRIKAGYGYELKVKVRYKTNALSTQPTKVNIPTFANRADRTGKGTSVRPYNVAPNIPQDIFIKAPGMSKALSVSGTRGTSPSVDVKRTGSNGDQVFEYTLKSKDNFGIKESGKLYVGKDVKDGQYEIQVWTPVINGIPTKNMSVEKGLTVYEPSLLADLQRVQFEVKGSATDDLVDTIIQ